MSIWKRKGKRDPLDRTAGAGDLADIYVTMRTHLLEGMPEQEGWTAFPVDGVWAAAMEMEMSGFVVTLSVAADSPTGAAVSLYFSNGGGVIGCGAHEGPRLAGRFFLNAASRAVGLAAPTVAYPLPSPDAVRFFIRTADGTCTAEQDAATLSNDGHPLSELFHAGQAVITQIRLRGDLGE